MEQRNEWGCGEKQELEADEDVLLNWPWPQPLCFEAPSQIYIRDPGPEVVSVVVRARLRCPVVLQKHRVASM